MYVVYINLLYFCRFFCLLTIKIFFPPQKNDYGNSCTVGAKEIFTLLKRRKKITARQGIKFHIPLSLLSVGRV